MIHPFLKEKFPEIKKILKQCHVTSAHAFGSVCTDKFNIQSDVDLLISFDENLEPLQRGELWWDLYYSLKDFLKREIDIVTVKSLHNPYFIKELNETKQFIYAE